MISLIQSVKEKLNGKWEFESWEKKMMKLI